jgi:hypothetical protein
LSQARHSPLTLGAPAFDDEAVMKARRFPLGTRLVAAVTLCALTSCASSTLIQSQPPGARLFLDGQPVGVTPYMMSDAKIAGATTMVHLEAPGYLPTDVIIARNEEIDVGALIGGIFLLVPFLWIMGYRPFHVFELRPAYAPGYAPGYGASPYYPPPATSPWEAPPAAPAPPPAAPAPAPAPTRASPT